MRLLIALCLTVRASLPASAAEPSWNRREDEQADRTASTLGVLRLAHRMRVWSSQRDPLPAPAAPKAAA